MQNIILIDFIYFIVKNLIISKNLGSQNFVEEI